MKFGKEFFDLKQAPGFSDFQTPWIELQSRQNLDKERLCLLH